MKLGCLFWKYFLMFWLAQIITAVSVMAMIWAFDRVLTGPPAHRPHEYSVEQTRVHATGQVPRGPLLSPVLPIAAGSIVSLIFAWLLAFYFARPTRTLDAALPGDANGTVDTRVGQAMGRRHDGLADLCKDFDVMADPPQSLFESHRRLLHDVSSDLRLPLERLQAASDLSHRQAERESDFIARIPQDVDGVNDEVGEFLAHTGLGTGLNDPSRDLFSLTELIYDVAADVRFEAEPKGCTIELALCDGLNVHCNAQLLRRAVENVLRNAVRHSPTAHSIYVSAKEVDDYAQLSIRDAGSGVDPSDLQRIFDPFYRAAEALVCEGHGLGPTITQRFVKLCGGSVLVEHLSDGGFVVHMRLPLVQPQSSGQADLDLRHLT